MIDTTDVNIFISYSSKNNVFAEKLMNEIQSKLGESKLQVWMSELLRRGSYWRNEIDTAIEAASLVVLIISPDSMDSAYVTYEWSYAWFKLNKEPYPIYFEYCDKSTGMFGRYMEDFQIPPNDCLNGDENSRKLASKIQDIIELIKTLPDLNNALNRLNNIHLDEYQRRDAALEIGRANRYLKTTAYNYLIQGLKRQLSGSGRNGVVAQGIADAFAELGDNRAIAPLWQLDQVAGGYEYAHASIEAAINTLSRTF